MVLHLIPSQDGGVTEEQFEEQVLETVPQDVASERDLDSIMSSINRTLSGGTEDWEKRVRYRYNHTALT